VDDPYKLSRFVAAQDGGDMYELALSELRAGRKLSHWMWFVFPQIAGLGTSAMSRTYAISCLDEARAYLAHPILGPRLIECARAVSALGGRSADEIFGVTDAKKFHSSITLFARAAPDYPLFQQVLQQRFAGVADEATDRQLAR
jgi:uncharacterized protein (DUF1810 family)